MSWPGARDGWPYAKTGMLGCAEGLEVEAEGKLPGVGPSCKGGALGERGIGMLLVGSPEEEGIR